MSECYWFRYRYRVLVRALAFESVLYLHAIRLKKVKQIKKLHVFEELDALSEGLKVSLGATTCSFCPFDIFVRYSTLHCTHVFYTCFLFPACSHDLSDQLSPSPGGPRSSGAGAAPPLRHGIANLLPSAVRPSASGSGSGHSGDNIMMSPPMSPARKKAADPDRAKRPMNGFMLFAKKYRLELIQQHPGKDNRAISVLLGEAWKGLPMEDREQYSHKAKVRSEREINKQC